MAQTQFGSWAERNTPQQILWEKRISSKEPEVLDTILRMYDMNRPIVKNLNNSQSGISAARRMLAGGEYVPPRNSEISLDVYRAVRHKYNNLFINTVAGISKNNMILSPTGTKPGSAQSVAGKFNINFQPISSFIGTTLYTTPGVHSSPLHVGSCPTVSNCLERVSPRFKQEMVASQASLKLDEMSHLPSQLIGSVRNLASSTNDLLSGPFNMVKDIYKGAMGIITTITTLLNTIFKAIQRFIIMAIGAVTSMLLQAVKGLINGIVGAVMSVISRILNVLKQYTGVDITSKLKMSVLTDIASNALQSKASGAINLKMPSSVNTMFQNSKIGNMRGLILNPIDSIRKNFIPDSIDSKMQAVMQRPSSFGMVGANAYNFSQQLQGTRESVLASVMQKYSPQAGIIKNLFYGQSPLPSNYITGCDTVVGSDNKTKYNVNIGGEVVRSEPPGFIIDLK